MIDPAFQLSLLPDYSAFWFTSQPSARLGGFWISALAGPWLPFKWFLSYRLILLLLIEPWPGYQSGDLCLDSISLIGSHSISNLVYYGLLIGRSSFISAFKSQSLFKRKGQATSLRVLRFIGLLALHITVPCGFILPDQGSYHCFPPLPSFAMILFVFRFIKRQAANQASSSRSPSSHDVDFPISLQSVLLPLFNIFIWLVILANEYILPAVSLLKEVCCPVYYMKALQTGKLSMLGTPRLVEHIRRAAAYQLLLSCSQLCMWEQLKIVWAQNGLENSQPKYILLTMMSNCCQMWSA